MTTQQYIEISRDPTNHTIEEVEAALRYWHRRAVSAREDHQVIAQIRRTRCLNALHAQVSK